MTPKIIDISIPLENGMPVWPKSVGPRLKRILSFKKGDSWTETEIQMNLHTGTHIDSPLHCIRGGVSIDKLPLNAMIGPAFVVYLPKVKAIIAKDLENLNLPKDTSRLLFRTSNSNFWQKKEKKFQKDFVGLAPDAASWIANRGIELVGIDYLSIAQFKKTTEVHRILLKNGIIILEGLNLSKVKQGVYQLICLPLKLINTEAALTRAMLISYGL